MSTAPLLPALADEAAYRAVRGDPATWLPAMTAICARHGLAAEDLYATPHGTNVVFHVRGGPWIKLFPALWAEDALHERVGLETAASAAGVRVPPVLAAGELEGWPYLVLGHLEGRAIGTVWRDLPPGVQRDLAHELGALLARLHAVDTAGCGPIARDWPTRARALRAEAVARQAGYGLAPDWLEALARFVEALPPMDDGRTVFLHADVTDDHVFVAAQGGRWHVTGLIDFGDCMVGDWRYEFAAPLVFLMQGRPALQRALLAGYGLPPEALTPALRRALVAWAFLHRWGRIPTYVRFAPEPAPRSLAALATSIFSPS